MNETSRVDLPNAARKLSRELLNCLFRNRLEISALHEVLDISAVVELCHNEEHALGLYHLNQLEYVVVLHAV